MHHCNWSYCLYIGKCDVVASSLFFVLHFWAIFWLNESCISWFCKIFLLYLPDSIILTLLQYFRSIISIHHGIINFYQTLIEYKLMNDIHIWCIFWVYKTKTILFIPAMIIIVTSFFMINRSATHYNSLTMRMWFMAP